MARLATASARPLSKPRIGKGRISRPAQTRPLCAGPLKLPAGGNFFPFATMPKLPLYHLTRPTRCSIGARKRRSHVRGKVHAGMNIAEGAPN
jgi:hypothetical protein